MNAKQKMIEAMAEHRQTCANAGTVVTMVGLLDAALAVLADPANWTLDMDRHVALADWMTGHGPFIAVINHIREQEPKP